MPLLDLPTHHEEPLWDNPEVTSFRLPGAGFRHPAAGSSCCCDFTGRFFPRVVSDGHTTLSPGLQPHIQPAVSSPQQPCYAADPVPSLLPHVKELQSCTLLGAPAPSASAARTSHWLDAAVTGSMTSWFLGPLLSPQIASPSSGNSRDTGRRHLSQLLLQPCQQRGQPCS